ncbi:MAG: aminodeoxychorismate synthase component I [Candidatus Saganbacteria bacterium]|nr:aminodeoxychorismate synthase component I [Candidatus Saganbacteria bacterium]
MYTDKEKNLIILEDSGIFRVFEKPKRIISCNKIDGVETCLREIEAELGNGRYLAGFISYEAGYAFEKKLKGKSRYSLPLVWFGVFDKFRETEKIPHNSKKYNISNISLNISKREYLKNIQKIKRLIERGDTYQVNFTMKYKFNFSGSALKLYQELRERQPVPYSAYIGGDGFKALSFSPELFLEKSGRKMIVKPMKGTVTRGRNLDGDKKNEIFLLNDSKNRSENIMIVDLLRNDLGKISKTGSVKVKKLFEAEKYQTLYQMTSTIGSKLSKNVSFHDIFKALFPSGSVTGAPKIRTMQIISELEKEPRKIYTGAIGYIAPDGIAKFNVAIRTILIKGKKAEMGIGSGIIYDSDPDKEYDECKLKADFLTFSPPKFQLIETMLWASKYGYFLKELHLERLMNSAAYFNFLFNENSIRKSLDQERKKLNPDRTYRIRLLLAKNGKIKISSSPIKPINTEVKIAISDKKTDPKNIYLFHKTTNRSLYDDELKKYQKHGCFDVIFTNERGEITEGAISNIFIRKDGKYYTPPTECGLLDGVFRKYFISNNEVKIFEKILYPDDLKKADEVLIANSVRGLLKAKIAQAPNKDLIKSPT